MHVNFKREICPYMQNMLFKVTEKRLKIYQCEHKLCYKTYTIWNYALKAINMHTYIHICKNMLLKAIKNYKNLKKIYIKNFSDYNSGT